MLYYRKLLERCMAKSRKYEDRLPVGEAIREFYSALDMIEEYYTKKGYRKMTMLHRVLKDKLNWKMPYDTFRYHFNKEFGSKRQSPLKEDMQNKPIEDSLAQGEHSIAPTSPKAKNTSSEPIILDPTNNSKKVAYQGSTKNIKRDEI